GLSLCCIRPEPAQRLLRVGPAALKTGSECSCTTVHSASSPVFALQDSSSRDRKQPLGGCTNTKKPAGRSLRAFLWRSSAGYAQLCSSVGSSARLRICP